MILLPARVHTHFPSGAVRLFHETITFGVNIMMKKLTSLLALLLVCAFGLPLAANASVAYLPGVTDEMTRPAFWAELTEEPDAVLASPEKIAALNAAALTTAGTNMHDLKNIPETFDGTARCESLKRGAAADASYYLSWTYSERGRKLEQRDFDKIIANTADSRARKNMRVKYGVVVNRSELLTFPYDGQILDDPADLDFDYQALVGLRVNEPVVIFTTSRDGKYYQIYNSCCSGWVRAEDVAVCRSRTEWLSAWDLPADRRLVVWGDKLFTDASLTHPETANRMVTMGTVLERIALKDPDALVINRLPIHNYAVYLPVRNADGSYAKREALINAREQVSEDYLPLTGANLASVALASLGDAYGWGGSLDNEDCSSLCRSIYLCFGLDLPRNGNWQWPLALPKADAAYMTTEEKEALLDSLPLGTLMTFPGHMMMYLGKYNGEYYVCSTVSSMMSPYSGNRQRSRCAQINRLDIRRANGMTWLQAMNRFYIPWMLLSEGEKSPLPESPWYHEGTAYCLEKKLIDTFDGGYFRPEEKATRGETALALYRAFGSPETPEGAEGFADLESGSKYEKAVLWCASQGITNGVDGKFLPESAVSREMLAALLFRAANASGQTAAAAEDSESALAAFEDAAKAAPWAKEPLAWAVENGIINGKTAARLAPKGAVTRAELAVILMRAERAAEDK